MVKGKPDFNGQGPFYQRPNPSSDLLPLSIYYSVFFEGNEINKEKIFSAQTRNNCHYHGANYNCHSLFTLLHPSPFLLFI
jgi:hypothetical protein